MNAKELKDGIAKVKVEKLNCLTCQLEELVIERRKAYDTYSRLRGEEDLLRKQCEELEMKLTPITICPPIRSAKALYRAKSGKSAKKPVRIPTPEENKAQLKRMLMAMTHKERLEFLSVD